MSTVTAATYTLLWLELRFFPVVKNAVLAQPQYMHCLLIHETKNLFNRVVPVKFIWVKASTPLPKF